MNHNNIYSTLISESKEVHILEILNDIYLSQILPFVLSDKGISTDTHISSLLAELDFTREKNRKPWLMNKNVIAIVGKFSSGKSSILNTLLEQDLPPDLKEKLMPVDSLETTAISTYISFSRKFSVGYIDAINDKKAISHEDFLTFKKENSEELKLNKLIRNFIIDIPNSNFNDIVLVDTPGYNAIDTNDKKRALASLKEADYVLWVLSVGDGELTRDSIELIKAYLMNKKIIVIINKCDLKSSRDREGVRNKIVQTLTDYEIPYTHCIEFSSKNEKELHKANFERILNEIQSKPLDDAKIKLWDMLIHLIGALKNKIDNCILNAISVRDTLILEQREMLNALNDYERKMSEGVFNSGRYNFMMNEAKFIKEIQRTKGLHKIDYEATAELDSDQLSYFEVSGKCGYLSAKINQIDCEIARYKGLHTNLVEIRKNLDNILTQPE